MARELTKEQAIAIVSANFLDRSGGRLLLWSTEGARITHPRNEIKAEAKEDES